MARNPIGHATRTVFYSWQNDTPAAANRFFIRGALKKALARISKSEPTAAPLLFDDATRGAAGSVMIVDSILDKIGACEVFVADISIISEASQRQRRTPNPNVMLEVGWAAARLGWNRVVLVFNKTTGTLEQDVPFDIRGRLILQYELTDGNPDKKPVEEILSGKLGAAVRVALGSPPPVRRKLGTRSLSDISAEEQHRRDRDTIHRLLGRLDTQWLDAYLENLLNERILHDADVHFIAFNGVLEESRFRLFDRRSETLIRDFAAAWSRLHDATSYGDAIPGLNYARFRPESYGHGEAITRMRKELHAARDLTYDTHRAMIRRVRRTYANLDLNESDRRAREYINSL